jgi:hypothetical protein
MRFWERKRKEEDMLRLDIRVHLNYRVGALAELMTIVTARQAIIINFSAKGADHALGLGESYVDLALAVRGCLHKDSLLAEIRAAGFSCEEIPFAERQSD